MKFEEILPLLKEGKKIRRASDDKEISYIKTKIGIDVLGQLPRYLIAKLRNGYLHPDMNDHRQWGLMNSIDLFAEDWEVVDERD